MDHISSPGNESGAIDVPIVTTPTYDAGDFETYSVRVGLPLHDDITSWQEIDPSRTAAFVQSWLYFGLIFSFFGHDIRGEDFVRNAPQGKAVATSRVLLPLLDNWLASAANVEGMQKARLETLLELSAAALRNFSLLPQSKLSPMPEILLSVRLLISTFRVAMRGDGSSLAELRPWTSADPAADLLEQKLLAAGWCPWKVRQILSEYSCATIYYISQLREPIAPHISHAKCTRDRCIGNNVDMANYTTRHTDPSCPCRHSSIPDQKMRFIIAKGGVPIVRVKLSRNRTPYLEVRSATPQTRYIAISHVWSDGLGNPHANSLPQCQLQRLSQSVKLLAPPIFDFAQGYISIPQLNIGFDGKRMALTWGSTEWFWLDTLCIPVGSDDQSVFLKFKAINQMAAIYAGAHQVLVLDSVMQASRMAGRDLCHILAQMSALAWLGRSWTYQEGALALSLQVQCADCSFHPAQLSDFTIDDLDSSESTYLLLPGTTTADSTWHRLQQALGIALKQTGMVVFDLLGSLRGIPVLHKRTLKGLLAGHIFYQLESVVGREMCYQRRDRNPFVLSGETSRDFVLCWNSLVQRTTTMAGDVHVIIANLLRLNAFSILAMTSQEERMRAILWSLSELPVSLLFNQSPQRVRPTEQHGNRWMPLWPDRSIITELPALKIEGAVLTLSSSEINKEQQKPKLLMLDLLVQASSDLTELLVSVNTPGSQSKRWYRVVLHRLPGDQFDSNRFQSTIFIFQAVSSHPSSHEEIPAACLHTNVILYKHPTPNASIPGSCQGNFHEREAQLHTIFDCPATMYFLGTSLPSLFAHLPQYTATSLENYTLAIEHDVPLDTQPLPQRPQNPSFLAVTLLLLGCSHSFNFLLCAMNALVIYQGVSARNPYPFSIQVVSKLTIITHGPCFLALVYFAPPIAAIPTVLTGLGFSIIPFSIGLAYIVLKAGVMAMDAIDKAILALLVTGHVPPMLMGAVVRWYVNPRVWRAWLETYEPDWEPGKTDWLLLVVLKMMQGWGKRLDELGDWFRR